ncbi:MAG TPA: hypothetical protein DCZ10_17450 [Pelotomaculum sp.]|nr:hypothetical protein [Pelotomaculum sp.]
MYQVCRMRRSTSPNPRISVCWNRRRKSISIYQEVLSAVKRAQELHSDFLGLGERISETNPDLWKGLDKTWHDEWLPMYRSTSVSAISSSAPV